MKSILYKIFYWLTGSFTLSAMVFAFSFNVNAFEEDKGTTLPGNWTLIESIDPFEDTLSITIHYVTDDEKAVISMACVDNSITAVFVLSEEYIGSSTGSKSGILVKYRVDKNVPVEYEWEDGDILLEGKNGFALWEGDAIKFLKDIYQGKEKLIIRIHDF